MKICIVCARLSYGGAERVAVLWANGFFDVGHQVMVISNLFDPITYLLDERIMVRNLVADNRNKLKKWGSSFFQVRKAIKEFCPDVIIGVMPTCSFVSKVASWGLGIPIIATEHNSFERPEPAPFSIFERFSKFELNRLYHAITVLTSVDKSVIEGRFHNVQVIPNPLLLEPVDDIPQKEKKVLAAGRLDGWYVKGFDVLIRAWANVVSGFKFRVSSEGWRLQIAGTGSEGSLNFLKQLCKEKGVEDSVEFLGFVSDMESLYKKASVFVLSSRYEGFGLVLIEAMSQGCACVACDYKGRQREIISPTPALPRRGEEDPTQPRTIETRNLTPETNDCMFEACDCGILCEPDDVEALASGIQKMIEEDEYRESVRKNAIERSKYYSVDNTIGRWENLLSQILKN